MDIYLSCRAGMICQNNLIIIIILYNIFHNIDEAQKQLC